jgi:hypothetical protein
MLLICSRRISRRGGTMDSSASAQRRTFSHWLRTGRLPRPRAADGRELKFNPYHDPDNGRFTFAPGGPRSLASVVVSAKRRPKNSAPDGNSDKSPAAVETSPRLTQAVYHPDDDSPLLRQVAAPRGGSPMRRGGNIRAFHDPLTLEQVFPRLRDAPGGAIVALADNIFDLTGPAREATAGLAENWLRLLADQIQAVDHTYTYRPSAPSETMAGRQNELNALRFERAAAFLRVRSELRPLQVETLRFLQERTDIAYAEGLRRLKASKLRIRLSEQEALGNFIDRRVRLELRQRYNQYGIDSDGKGPVRVNRRENDSSGTELTFRRPDARVGNIAFDVTLTAKTLKTPQVRGFFETDFRPDVVIIIRPRQLGDQNTYAIRRPEAKR